MSALRLIAVVSGGGTAVGGGHCLAILNHELSRVVGTALICKRGIHDVVQGQHDNLSAYRRGKGGRGSFSGMVATVFGATGFAGRYVVHRLAKIGSQVIIPYRCDPYFVRDLKLAGDLGQVLFLPFHLRDEESIRKCLKYSNVCINLIGRDWETKNFKFEDIHVTGARNIARIARECGVERFIHVSHLNATPNPTPIFVSGGSKYLKTKYYGELAVQEEFPDATIFRPADMYGIQDRFIHYYSNMWRRQLGMMPLWKSGTQTVKRPVFLQPAVAVFIPLKVFNVAEGIINALADPGTAGKTYECIGPHSYYLSDLVDYFYRCMRFPIRRIPVNPLFKMKVHWLSLAPGTPITNIDRLDREHVSDIIQDHLTLEDLGVKLTQIEDRADYELRRHRTHRYYEEKVGEFAHPYPPPIIEW